MIELTLEQGQAVVRQGEVPPRAVDPGTQTTYVLIREEVYNRMRALFVEEEDNRFLNEMYPHVMEVFGNESAGKSSRDSISVLFPRNID